MGFGESWMISVMMRFTSNGSRVMREVAIATRAANAAVDAQTAKVNRATAAMERFRTTTVGLGTSIAGAFAMAGAAVDAFSMVQAAKLQRTLTAIRNETGADPRKMGGVYNSVFSIANRIGVSPVEAAQAWLDVSRLTAGQLSVKQMQQVAPRVLDFASMLHFNRPDVSVDEATKAGLQLVHLFRAYQPKQMLPLLDQVYRLSGLMAETPSQAVRQMSYYEPLFKGLKIDNNTSVAMMALLDRAGFRMKVGTNVRAAMLEALGPLQLTSHAQQAKLGMLEQMGVFKGGKFAWNLPGGSTDFIGMLTAVAQWSQGKAKQGVPLSDLAKTLYGTFGKQGGNIMQLMADPIMLQILGQIRAYQKNPNVSLSAGISNRDSSLAYQAGRAWGNLQAVLTELGYTEVPNLTNAFKNLANTFHTWQSWLHAHREAERLIAGTALGATGFMAGRFALGGIGTMLGFLGGLSKIKGLEGVSKATKALMFLDNVVTAGMVGRMLNLGKAISGLTIAGQAANDVGAFSLSISNLLAVFSKIGGVLGTLGLGALISANQQGSAKAAYDAMAKRYGSKYANSLLGQEGWPWNFDPAGTKGGLVFPRGALSPGDWNALNQPHITIEFHDKTGRGIQSQIKSRGQIFTNPRKAGVLNLSNPNLGLTQ
jgi:hypothetical protein